VVEFVRREAQRYGAAITRSELVGLIPQAALVDAAQWYLQLDDLKPEQVIENRLMEAGEPEAGEAPGARPRQADFLDRLAAGTATPGGGAASAYAGAMAAGLIGMVARLTVGKKKYAGVETLMRTILERVEPLRQALTAAVTDDSAAFDAVMEAFGLPKATDEQQALRQAAIQTAYTHAAEVPLRVARAVAQVLDLAAQTAEHANVNALSDSGSAAYLAQSSIRGAALNVRANAAVIADKALGGTWLDELAGLEARAAAALEAVERQLRERH
jgi:glutamate formiminotransferase / formiminotetrahydrofolate cyclodeaminase